MAKYRKRAVVVDISEPWMKMGDHPAVARVPGYTVARAINDHTCDTCHCWISDHGWVKTLEGGHRVCPGDRIVTGVAGELYPIKPDIFAATYDKVEEEIRVPLLDGPAGSLPFQTKASDALDAYPGGAESVEEPEKKKAFVPTPECKHCGYPIAYDSLRGWYHDLGDGVAFVACRIEWAASSAEPTREARHTIIERIKAEAHGTDNDDGESWKS